MKLSDIKYCSVAEDYHDYGGSTWGLDIEFKNGDQHRIETYDEELAHELCELISNASTK